MDEHPLSLIYLFIHDSIYIRYIRIFFFCIDCIGNSLKSTAISGGFLFQNIVGVVED